MLGDLSKEVVAGARVAEIVQRREQRVARGGSAWKPAQLCSQPWLSARPSYW